MNIRPEYEYGYRLAKALGLPQTPAVAYQIEAALIEIFGESDPFDVFTMEEIQEAVVGTYEPDDFYPWEILDEFIEYEIEAREEERLTLDKIDPEIRGWLKLMPFTHNLRGEPLSSLVIAVRDIHTNAMKFPVSFSSGIVQGITRQTVKDLYPVDDGVRESAYLGAILVYQHGEPFQFESVRDYYEWLFAEVEEKYHGTLVLAAEDIVAVCL